MSVGSSAACCSKRNQSNKELLTFSIITEPYAHRKALPCMTFQIGATLAVVLRSFYARGTDHTCAIECTPGVK